MTRIEQIEQEIAKLSPQEARQLSQWLEQYLSDQWDREIEEDAKAGRLDRLWEEAEEEIASGEARPLNDLLDNP